MGWDGRKNQYAPPWVPPSLCAGASPGLPSPPLSLCTYDILWRLYRLQCSGFISLSLVQPFLPPCDQSGTNPSSLSFAGRRLDIFKQECLLGTCRPMNRQNMGRNKTGMSLPNAHSDPKELRAEQGQLVELLPPAGTPPSPPQRSQTPNVQP